ncbi:hypothetical protein A1D11_10655 [Bacillus subtilis subsp. globigii]|nr:hypothetical protein A1D11_10655 [Bacillus subtilis subsp. globigii]EIM09045.1 hypothetical protein UY9_19269 [Bacillus atrophaeus C89]
MGIFLYKQWPVGVSAPQVFFILCVFPLEKYIAVITLYVIHYVQHMLKPIITYFHEMHYYIKIQKTHLIKRNLFLTKE